MADGVAMPETSGHCRGGLRKETKEKKLQQLVGPWWPGRSLGCSPAGGWGCRGVWAGKGYSQSCDSGTLSQHQDAGDLGRGDAFENQRLAGVQAETVTQVSPHSWVPGQGSVLPLKGHTS